MSPNYSIRNNKDVTSLTVSVGQESLEGLAAGLWFRAPRAIAVPWWLELEGVALEDVGLDGHLFFSMEPQSLSTWFLHRHSLRFLSEHHSLTGCSQGRQSFKNTCSSKESRSTFSTFF